MEEKMEEYAAVLEENIRENGVAFETVIAMEECAELIQAISKVRRYGCIGKYRDNLIEEMADVDIILTELMIMFDITDEKAFYDVIDKKIQRLRKRLEEKR